MLATADDWLIGETVGVIFTIGVVGVVVFCCWAAVGEVNVGVPTVLVGVADTCDAGVGVFVVHPDMRETNNARKIRDRVLGFTIIPR